MADRNAVFRYFLTEYFDGDLDKMSAQTGFYRADLLAWKNDERTPQRKTIEYLMNITLTPEFKLISEFFKLDGANPILPQLREMYRGHEDRSGVYSFYDSMARLVYLGKATNLLTETYSAIRRDHELVLPAGIQNQIVPRYRIVRYISAYEVKVINGFDYPKHVESLILRISKPVMNRQIGRLEPAYPTLADTE